MKFSFVYVAGIAAGCLACLACAAQTKPATAPPQQQAAPQDQPKGRVIFSRSTDENGQTTTQSAQPTAQPAAQVAAAPSVEDAEREAVTFTALDLDVHLRPADQQIAVRALLTVRNDGKGPLARLPLQISSSLNWERIRVEGKDAAFQVATLNSDADHTGQLHEAAVPLAQPLAAGQSLQLDVTYSGQIALSAQRLLAVGAPAEVAEHSDWDQISLTFTGLRGFGNVVWYPVSSVPVMLGDGARLFDEMGEHKLRLSGAHFRLRLTVEFPHGQAPIVALIDGHSVPLTVTEPSSALDQNQEVESVATADLDDVTLGFEAPSLFVAIRAPHLGTDLVAWTLPEDQVSVEFWTKAAADVAPFLDRWLGQKPRSVLTLLDLPDSKDSGFETGSLLAAPLRELPRSAIPDSLDGILVHALTHAWITSANSPHPPPAWLNEGVAQFMGTLWIEKAHGRDEALGMLEHDRAALALAEPGSPGESPGQPLAQATSPVYYRTKAAYVLWMLRDLAGDPALSAAFRGYYSGTGNLSTNAEASQSATAESPVANSAAQTKASSAVQLPARLAALAAIPVPSKPVIRSAFEKRLEDIASPLDLGWFFADWVDADKGLPDVSIESVFPNAVSDGNWLVAVDLGNAGYAAAEIPVIVRSGTGPDARSVTQRVLVPARGKVTERILIQGKPTEVQANDGAVPESEASIHIKRLDGSGGAPASSSQPAPE